MEGERAGPPHSEVVSDWVGGQGGGARKVRLQWKEAALVTSALQTVPLQHRIKEKDVLKSDQNKVNLVFRNAREKLTFDELDHFLVGHGGNERAVHLTDGGADCQRCGKTTKRVRFGVCESESPL